MNGEVETVTANKNAEYKIAKNETHLVHALIEAKTFDQATGQKTSVEILQSFYPKDFAQMDAEKAFLGKSVEIVHMPAGDELSAAKKAVEAGPVNTTGTGPVNDDSQPAVIDVKKMQKPQLLVEYAKHYGADDDASKMTVPELKEAIQAKLDEAENQPNNPGEEPIIPAVV